jgi:peptidoglycan/LPS O-acetylase OafA/YrhL
MKNKIEVIDFIKGYSILTIVLFHYFQGIQLSSLFSKAINFGGTGTHTFLFCSGFGLYLSHLRNPIRWPMSTTEEVKPSQTFVPKNP